MTPGVSATVLVAFAMIDGTPVNTSAGNVRKDPPPATAFRTGDMPRQKPQGDIKRLYPTFAKPLVRFHDPPIVMGSRLFRLLFKVCICR